VLDLVVLHTGVQGCSIYDLAREPQQHRRLLLLLLLLLLLPRSELACGGGGGGGGAEERALQGCGRWLERQALR
jgi:hypothetical protein